MWSIIVTWLQSAATHADIRTLVELATIVFFGGAAWQQLRDLKQRVARIEVKLFDGSR